jgi:hypothetical protein
MVKDVSKIYCRRKIREDVSQKAVQNNEAILHLVLDRDNISSFQE